jgi:acyl-CoA synthetase (AMP-forming)/AMP-acid ligase II
MIRLGSIHDHQLNRLFKNTEINNLIFNKIKYFKQIKINKKSNVILTHNNSIDFFIDLLAIWHLKACAICIDETTSEYELNNIINLTKSKHIIFKKKLKIKSKNIKSFLYSSCYFKTQSTDKEFQFIFDENLKKNALILFTSGTTGKPKGVVHTYYTLSQKWKSLRRNFSLKNINNSLCLLPTHFGHGLICNCLFPLFSNKKLFIFPKFNMSLISNLGRIIDKYNINHLSSVPSMWKIVLKLSRKPKNKSLKVITCGSAPLNSNLWKRIQKWSSIKSVWNTYGITETGSWIAGTSKNNFIPRDGLIGKPWGASFKILSAKIDDNKVKIDERYIKNKSLKRNKVGYVWVKTSSLMRGYFKRNDLSRQVIKDEWFFTGDIGKIDKSNNLYLFGRERNEINVSGLKVIPEDIDIILEKNKNIIEACTFGVENKFSGEMVVSAIARSSQKISEIYLRKWCQKHLSLNKIPKIFFFMKEIPKNSRGKLDRISVKNIYLNEKKN